MIKNVIFPAIGSLALAISSVARADEPPPAAPPQHAYLVFFDYLVSGETSVAQDVTNLAAAAYGALDGVRIDVIGHTDTAEADDRLWKIAARKCPSLKPVYRRGDPTCRWATPELAGLGLLRARSVADFLVTAGVPRAAVRVTTVGAASPLVATPPATREPQNRFVAVRIHGGGKCMWRHLPESDRGRAIQPGAYIATADQFAANFSAAVAESDGDAAIDACGNDASRVNPAKHALAYYAIQMWAEHTLFVEMPHIWPRQLEPAWAGVDSALRHRIGQMILAGGAVPQSLIDTALSQLDNRLSITTFVSNGEEAALRNYIIARAGRDEAEARL